MDKMKLIVQAIGTLEEALETARLAVSQNNVGLAIPAAGFANAAASLLLYAAEEETVDSESD